MDNHYIRIVLVERQHLNLPNSPCNPDPGYNFRECVYGKVLKVSLLLLLLSVLLLFCLLLLLVLFLLLMLLLLLMFFIFLLMFVSALSVSTTKVETLKRWWIWLAANRSGVSVSTTTSERRRTKCLNAWTFTSSGASAKTMPATILMIKFGLIAMISYSSGHSANLRRSMRRWRSWNFWKSSIRLAAKNLVVTGSIASYDDYDDDKDHDNDDDYVNSAKVTP